VLASFLVFHRYSPREKLFWQYVLDKCGRQAIDTLSGPKLSGAIKSETLKRGELDVSHAVMCLTIPSVRQLRLEQQKREVSSESAGISTSMMTAAAKQLPPDSLVVLKFDETDLCKRLETDHAGNWFGDIDLGGLEVDSTPFVSIRKEFDNKMEAIRRAKVAVDKALARSGAVSADSASNE
jgi:hypothetical protein